MSFSPRQIARPLWIAVRALLVLTVILGLAYPLLVTGLGQLFFPGQANGSLLSDQKGETVGSALIGQEFLDEAGDPLPQYFQPRPSAAGEGYDPSSSSGSNLGPNSQVLADQIEERKAQIAEFNGVSPDDVPPDAVTASGSGLDPHISPDYAAIQVRRVATARGLSQAEVRSLVEAHTQAPDLGYIGESRVNVVELNLALDAL